MRAIAGHFFSIFLSLGGFGLIALGMLDSSFLVAPLGNDVLLVALVARDHSKLPFYAAMATAGSVIGCFFVDVLARKGGEEGLKKLAPARRLGYVKRKVQSSAPWALTMASIMPPPFPFTPFVAAAAAFQYPRAKLLAVIGAARLTRFLVVGSLAIFFGRRIIRLAESKTVETAILAFAVFCAGASIWSVYSLIRRSRG